MANKTRHSGSSNITTLAILISINIKINTICETIRGYFKVIMHNASLEKLKIRLNCRYGMAHHADLVLPTNYL